MNDFFSNIVTSRNLPESQNADPFLDHIDHPTLKAIMKSRNHPSVLAITAVHEIRRGLHSVLLHLQMLQKRLISLIAQKQYKKLIFQ